MAHLSGLHQIAGAQFIVSVWSLSCYICGDNNLEEFGECSTQFQYDCQSYALRFPRDENIYCRTTRHKAPNNTYTVMKECISEQDHYRTFPGKGYTIEEECDLAEVKGEEVYFGSHPLLLRNGILLASSFRLRVR
uniref:Protein quiver n=1 Tax=Angiostrongylus cantonensis TaxID=6313 RepID=A0A0K0DFK3_ANGCA